MSRRPTRIALVFVLLAAIGLFLATRPPDMQPTVKSSPGQSKPASKSSNAFYNAVCDGKMTASTSGTLKDKSLEEISGMIASRLSDDTYWVHNDSGNAASIYAVSGEGKLLGSFNLEGVTATDWEDIASGAGPVAGKPYLYLADTGDNDLARDEVEIYRFPEPMPDIGGGQAAVNGIETLRFSYPDGSAHNVEAVFVDPVSGKIYLIDKSDSRPGQIFEAPSGLADGTRTVLAKVGDIGYQLSSGKYEKITAADISPSGNSVAIRSYQDLYVYDRPTGRSVVEALSTTACTVPAFSEAQGEAVSFTRSGNGLVTTSEGAKQPIHQFIPDQ